MRQPKKNYIGWVYTKLLKNFIKYENPYANGKITILKYRPRNSVLYSKIKITIT